jgi:hypothetical protein
MQPFSHSTVFVTGASDPLDEFDSSPLGDDEESSPLLLELAVGVGEFGGGT